MSVSPLSAPLPARKEMDVMKEMFETVNYIKNVAQFNHWFAQKGETYHRTIGQLYEDISGMEDSLFEKAIGACGTRLKSCCPKKDLMIFDMKLMQDELCRQCACLRNCRKGFSEYPEIQNELDNMINTLNQFTFLSSL